jgi:hypothetical protein
MAPESFMKRIELILLLLSTLFSATALSEDFYVSTSGSDVADGLSPQSDKQEKSGPFKTLERAQRAVRDLKPAGQFKMTVNIHIAPGDYYLQNPLEFDIRDNGTPDKQINWLGESGKVFISGGISLQNCQKTKGEIWNCPVNTANLDAIKAKYNDHPPRRGGIPGFNLFVNQQRYHLARWPDQGWAHIKVPNNEGNAFSSFEPFPKIDTTASPIQLHGFTGSDWYDEYMPVVSIDADQNEIKLGVKPVYGLIFAGRYYLQNIKSELNAPLEWFYDKSAGILQFIPANGVTPEKIVVSSLPTLLKLQGTQYVNFKNLIFQYTTSSAIWIGNSHDITLDRLEISHMDGDAIEAKSSNRITVSNSHIFDTGERGIALEGGVIPSLQAANNSVENNHVHDFGTIIYSSSPGIHLQGVGTISSHNLVEQAAGLGVVINGNDHIFEKNEIRHVCEQTGDCGAIYGGRSLASRGNVVRYNSIHDIYGNALINPDPASNRYSYGPGGTRGVYLDDGLSGFTVFGNLFNIPGSIAIHIGGGRDNHIENNFIYTGNCAICIDNRGPGFDWEVVKKSLADLPWQGQLWQNKYPDLAKPIQHIEWPENNTIEHNIIITTKDDGKAFDYRVPSTGNSIGKNLVWGTQGKVSVYYKILDKPGREAYTSWQAWISEGIELDSIVADPCASINGNILSFCPHSPVEKIGFKALPTDIGLQR